MKAFLLQVASIVRRVIGAPDYEAYVAHVSVHHPGCAPLSRSEFVRDRLAARYARPGSRCC
ncbi:MAG: YbdD/YjiX family protein [Gemmatimonadaceae bacterium]|nr:YbdD/YjiX family protein [Gemmatimonadaceae bacterium]